MLFTHCLFIKILFHNKCYVIIKADLLHSLYDEKTDKQFVIKCQNNYVVAPVFEKGNLVTTKSDKSYHGIGTKTIRFIVDSYHGITTFTVDNLFYAKIVVPL